MRPKKIEVTLAFLVMSLMPLVIWAALGIARQVYGANLSVWLLRLRVLRWIFWIAGVAVSFVTLVSNTHWSFSIGIGLWTFSLGLAFPQGWLKRYYARESLQSQTESPDGWWPTPRD